MADLWGVISGPLWEYWWLLMTGLGGLLTSLYSTVRRREAPLRLWVWVGVGCIALALVLALRDEYRELNRLRGEATRALSLAFKIDNRNNHKVLTVESRGRSIENLEVFAASFELDAAALQRRRLRYTISKYGGPLQTIPRVSGQVSVDLGGILPLANFPPEPGAPPPAAPAYRTNYCLRLTFVDAISKERLVHYEITSAVTAPSFVDRSEDTAIVGGSMEFWDFFLGVGPQLKATCRRVFEDQLREYS
jgi:hypothetical protein